MNDDVLQRLNTSFGSITYLSNQAKANYNAVVIAYKGHFGKRGYLDASYTRSMANDNGGIYPTSNLLSQYYGPSPDDAPNRFSMTGTYFVPSAAPNNVFLNRVTGGWGIE